MPQIVNISAYKFADLTDLKPLREDLLARCRELGLKGTILLASEGINLFLAGPADAIEAILARIRQVPGLESLAAKYSESDEQPFTRMLVKLKKEIIAFGVGDLNVNSYSHQKLPPAELKRWLDEGRELILLDTRNQYEVQLGTFTGAKHLDIGHFRQFPQAVKQLPEDWKDKPVVTFCTGGIRCEKAGPFMEKLGFRNIFQIEGGILKYFEEVGGDHYEGDCFVFDQRVGLDPCLCESDSAKCFACQSPLTIEDQADPRYVFGKSCPYCFVPEEEKQRKSLERRQAAIRRATSPLPGSVRYDNYRPVKVPARLHGATLIDFLAGILPHVPLEEWSARIAEGRFFDRERKPVGAGHVVSAGDRYYQKLEAIVEPDVNPDIRLIYEDEAILVLNKPAPLPVHPCGRFNRNTLQSILAEVYSPQSPRPAHRLDANTAGVMAFSRTRHFAGLLQPQFERGEVEKIYLARVHGHPSTDEFASDAPIRATSGDVGSRDVDFEAGMPSLTEFRTLKRFEDGTALVEARPRTGRTNQIRVHLWHLGHAIVGDTVYLPGGGIGDRQTIDADEAPLCLFACSLKFRHPVTDEPMTFEVVPPDWAST
ncbi:sulfurtransferase [bacterium]|nr:sulfurtransferase [bacterium]